MSEQRDMLKENVMARFLANPPRVWSTQRVVIDKWIELGGMRFSLEDLHETLNAIDSGGVMVSDDRMAKALLELEVISDRGSNRWMTDAKKGDNFTEFYDYVTALVDG